MGVDNPEQIEKLVELARTLPKEIRSEIAKRIKKRTRQEISYERAIAGRKGMLKRWPAVREC
jgi:hypothetical protein